MGETGKEPNADIYYEIPSVIKNGRMDGNSEATSTETTLKLEATDEDGTEEKKNLKKKIEEIRGVDARQKSFFFYIRNLR